MKVYFAADDVYNRVLLKSIDSLLPIEDFEDASEKSMISTNSNSKYSYQQNPNYQNKRGGNYN